MIRFFRDVRGDPCIPGGSVICLGSFDGVHLGHQALIQQTVQRARALKLTPTTICFEPLPREFFGRNPFQARVGVLRDRIRLFRLAGIEVVCLLHFTERLSFVSAEKFVTDLLVRRLQAREVWIGPGFRFGHRRCGDLSLLQELGAQWRFNAQAIRPVQQDGQLISSTRIRQLLAKGQLKEASRLLGYQYCISGHVVRGRQLGRTLGYPTANLRLKSVPALTGVYAAWVHGLADSPMPAVVNVGYRPTVAGQEPLVEAHVFDYHSDFYGRLIRVDFVDKLRDEQKFNNLEQLRRQLHHDALKARSVLKTVSS